MLKERSLIKMLKNVKKINKTQLSTLVFCQYLVQSN